MMEKAIEKINTEMQKNANDPYTEIIGQYVIDRCADPDVAGKVMQNGKTLKGAMEAITKRAQSQCHGNVAVLMPAAVFGEVDKYFGITTDEAAQAAAMYAAAGGTGAIPQRPAEPKSNVIKLDLESFL